MTVSTAQNRGGAALQQSSISESDCCDTLLTVAEVAELLRVPVSWVYERTRRRGSDQIPHLKLGKYLRFSRSALFASWKVYARGNSVGTFGNVDMRWPKRIMKTKQTAHKIISMVLDINKSTFGGQQVVTCYTCVIAALRSRSP